MTAITSRHRQATPPDPQLLRFAIRAGAALVGYGALLYSAARMRDVRRVGVAVLVGNVGFTLAVAVVLAAGWLPLTTFGVAATVAFTASTVGLAWLQYLGVRRTPA